MLFRSSTRAALHALMAMAGDRRTIAVLGAMLAQGDKARAEHLAMGKLAVELGVDLVVTVVGLEGADEVRWLAEGVRAAGGKAEAATDIAEARALIEGLLTAGDLVLVKGSNAVGLQPLGEQLAGQSAADAGSAQH